MSDKKFMRLYGGLDTRKSFGQEKETGVIPLLEGKNVDILGKTLRRANGQELKLTITSEAILGLASHEVDGIEYFKAVTDQANYYSINSSWVDTLSNNFGQTTFSPVASSDEMDVFSVTGNASLYDLQFNSDGTSIYTIDSTNDLIYQFVLPTAYDITSWTGTYKSFDPAEIGTSLIGFFIGNSDSKLYLCDRTNKRIYQYTITNGDVSTASYDSKYFYDSTGLNGLTTCWLDSTGTTLIAGLSSGKISKSTLSTAWDISSATYESIKQTDDSNDINSIFITSDNLYMYLGSGGATTVKYYTFGTALDISDITLNSSTSLSTTFGSGNYYGVTFNNTTGMYATKTTAPDIYKIVKATFSGFPIASGNIDPTFFQYKQYLITITGASDPFADDGTTITQTGLFDARSVYGTVGCAFHNRIFIASANKLYWTAANTYNDWTTTNDAGYKDDFVGDIKALKTFGSYLLIFTTQQIYILSGYDTSDFAFDHYSSDETFSKRSMQYFNKKLYSWQGSKGLFPIETTGDMSQVRFQASMCSKFIDELEEIDKDRLDEVMVLPYENRQQIWCYVPVSGESGLYKAYILNLINAPNTAAWYTREGNSVKCGCQFKGDIYTGTSAGKIYKEDSGNTFDGTAIESTVWFPEIRMGTAKTKLIEALLMHFDSEYLNKFVLNIVYDGKEDNVKTKSIDLSSKQDANNKILTKTLFIKDEWKSIKLGLTTTLTTQSYLLYGFEFMNVNIINDF